MEKYKVVRQPILTKSVRSIVENPHVLSFNSNVLACFSSYIGTPLITFWVRNHLVFHVQGMLHSTDCSTYEHLRMRICKAKELGCISKCGHFVFTLRVLVLQSINNYTVTFNLPNIRDRCSWTFRSIAGLKIKSVHDIILSKSFR